MVTFKLKEENDRQLVYWYFPHGNEENGHGTIVIDRVLGKLDVTELAPDDRLVRHTVENQNRWRKAVNQMRNIEQIPEFFFTEWMRGVRRLMSCTAWSVFSLAALVCALALFLAYLLAQRLPLRKAGFYGTLVAAAVFMLTSWFAMGERREMLDDTQAVVMSLSTAVKSSPDKSATDLFVLHEGTLVEITDRLDNWCEITIADGKKGWLECKTVETI